MSLPTAELTKPSSLIDKVNEPSTQRISSLLSNRTDYTVSQSGQKYVGQSQSQGGIVRPDRVYRGRPIYTHGGSGGKI